MLNSSSLDYKARVDSKSRPDIQMWEHFDQRLVQKSWLIEDISLSFSPTISLSDHEDIEEEDSRPGVGTYGCRL